jgi:hypothetical protein
MTRADVISARQCGVQRSRPGEAVVLQAQVRDAVIAERNHTTIQSTDDRTAIAMLRVENGPVEQGADIKFGRTKPIDQRPAKLRLAGITGGACDQRRKRFFVAALANVLRGPPVNVGLPPRLGPIRVLGPSPRRSALEELTPEGNAAIQVL